MMTGFGFLTLVLRVREKQRVAVRQRPCAIHACRASCGSMDEEKRARGGDEEDVGGVRSVRSGA